MLGVSSILYITFVTGRTLSVDIVCIKRKFYSACNSVLSKLGSASEPVLLHLVPTKCLPLLSYSLGAMRVSRQDIKQLSVAWNDAFRRIFQFHRWESVKELVYFCGELDFPHMYDLCQWKFLHNIHANFSYGAIFFKHLDTDIHHFECVYNCHSFNALCMKNAVLSKFEETIDLQLA